MDSNSHVTNSDIQFLINKHNWSDTWDIPMNKDNHGYTWDDEANMLAKDGVWVEPKQRIDYIFYNIKDKQKIKCKSIESKLLKITNNENKFISDHFGVISTLQID